MFVCDYCGKGCKSQNGLSQHISRTENCKKAQLKSAGCKSRETRLPPANEPRRLKRAKKTVEELPPPEPPGSPIHDLSDNESGDASEDDGLVADPGDYDTDVGEEDKDSEEDEEVDEQDEELDEQESEDGDGYESGSSTDSKPEPSREKLDQFRDYCNGLRGIMGLSRQKKSSIRLMDVLKRKKAPLNAFPELLEWHLKETGELMEHESLKNSAGYTHREPLLKDLYERCNMENPKPKIKKVRLPSSKAVVSIPYRSAADCIVSLLTDPRFGDEDYLCHGDSPWGDPPDNITHIYPTSTLERHT